MPELKSKPADHSSVERLLKENIELNEKIYESCQKTEKYIHFVKAFSIFKFIVILIPVIVGILYLLPVVGDFLEIYKGFFTSAGEMTGVLDAVKDIQGF